MENITEKELRLELKLATKAIDVSRVSLRLAIKSGSLAEIADAHSQFQENIKRALNLLGAYEMV